MDKQRLDQIPPLRYFITYALKQDNKHMNVNNLYVNYKFFKYYRADSFYLLIGGLIMIAAIIVFSILATNCNDDKTAYIIMLSVISVAFIFVYIWTISCWGGLVSKLFKPYLEWYCYKYNQDYQQLYRSLIIYNIIFCCGLMIFSFIGGILMYKKFNSINIQNINDYETNANAYINYCNNYNYQIDKNARFPY